MNTESCDMRRVANWWELHDKDEMKPGDFEIYETMRSRANIDKKPADEADTVRFKVCAMMLPGGHIAVIPLRPVPPEAKAYNGGHSWEWDGNGEAPTLNPSVHSVGIWHGWIRSGRMVSC